MPKLSMIAAALAAVLCAATSGALGETQGKKIALMQSTAAHPFNAGVAKALAERVKSAGIEVVVFSAQFNPATQAQQVDDAIARKFDVIAITAVSEKALVPALTRAKQAGVPVVLVTAPISNEYSDIYVTFLGEDPYKLGHIAGEALVKALKESHQDGGKVAMLTGSLQEGVAPIRVGAFKDAVKDNPKIEIVAVEDAKWDSALSEKAAGQLYARFASQGGLAAIYGMADNQAVAAIQAAEAANIPLGNEHGKLIVVGSNCYGPSMEMIKTGKMYSSAAQWPQRTGDSLGDLLIGMFNGKMPPKRVELPVAMITHDNIDQWIGPCSY